LRRNNYNKGYDFPCKRIGQGKKKEGFKNGNQYQTILNKNLTLKTTKLSRLNQFFSQRMAIHNDYFIFYVLNRNSFWRNAFRCDDFENVQTHWKKKKKKKKNQNFKFFYFFFFNF